MIEHEAVYTECTATKYWYDINNIVTPTGGEKCIDIYNTWREGLAVENAEMNPPTCVCEEVLKVDRTMEKTVKRNYSSYAVFIYSVS